MYEKIEIEEYFGNVSGYSVSYNDENYKNFLSESLNGNKEELKIIKFIENNKYENIVIIKNLNVEEEFRGNGFGNSLLEDAISSADIVFLISDKYESQIKGFLLDKFYEGNDFVSIKNTGTGILMCYPSEIAIELKEFLLKNKKCNLLNKL